VHALVFVGDAMEEEVDDLCHAARLLGVPAFMFQEGDNPDAEQAFREIARLTRGAYCRFDPGAAHELAELLPLADRESAKIGLSILILLHFLPTQLLNPWSCPRHEAARRLFDAVAWAFVYFVAAAE
jgi:hypothetical protein